MRLYQIFINYFRKGSNELNNKGLEDKREDKSEVIRKMDEDLLPYGWEKHETETHVTYTKELSESVSEVFRRLGRARARFIKM